MPEAFLQYDQQNSGGQEYFPISALRKQNPAVRILNDPAQ